jgi:hypothetical protein
MKERGQPLVLIFDHNREHAIDKIWVAKLAKSYLRKQGNRIVFSERNLAFQTYKKDMIFNAPSGHTLLYASLDTFWLAVHKAYKDLSNQSSEWSRIHSACASVGYEQVDMWHVPEREGFSAATPLRTEEVAQDAEDLSSSDEEGPEPGEQAAELGPQEKGDDDEEDEDATAGRGRTEQQGEGNQSFDGGEEFDPDWEIDPEFEEVIEMMGEDKDENQDARGERLCSAYARLVYLRGLRDARDGFKQKMESLGGMISWMACQSLNKYNVLRFMIMYEARKPFTYTHPETGKETSVDPQHCVRIVVDSFKPENEEIPEFFRWGQVFVKNRRNQQVIDREVDYWRGMIKEHCMDNMLPVPDQVAFIANSKHQRGNSFLCVYGSAQEAASVARRRVVMGACETLLRWHGVVNRRGKLKMAGGVSMPGLPTMKEASLSAKALTEHTLGHAVHHLVQPYYACDQPGQRVLSERSIRLKNLPADVTSQEIANWFEQEAGVRPTSVFKDNAAKNRESSQTVAMVAEFLSDGDCHEQEAVLVKAMTLNNSPTFLFRGARVVLQRIRQSARGEASLV